MRRAQRRGKLIGHVMPYWLVKPPTSSRLELSFPRDDLPPRAQPPTMLSVPNRKRARTAIRDSRHNATATAIYDGLEFTSGREVRRDTRRSEGGGELKYLCFFFIAESPSLCTLLDPAKLHREENRTRVIRRRFCARSRRKSRATSRSERRIGRSRGGKKKRRFAGRPVIRISPFNDAMRDGRAGATWRFVATHVSILVDTCPPCVFLAKGSARAASRRISGRGNEPLENFLRPSRELRARARYLSPANRRPRDYRAPEHLSVITAFIREPGKEKTHRRSECRDRNGTARN